MLRFRTLLQLRPRLRQLSLRLLQRILLHQNRLRQDVQRVRIPAHPLLQHLFRIHILLRKLRLLHAVNQIANHLLFLRSHFASTFPILIKIQSQTK